MSVVYYTVPKGEAGRFAQDLGAAGFDLVSSDSNVLFQKQDVVLVLYPDRNGRDRYEHRMAQLQEVGMNLCHCTEDMSVALVSEYHHPSIWPGNLSFLTKVVNLQSDILYFHFYAHEIFKSNIDMRTLQILRKNLHIVDSDGESLRSEIINALRLINYGIKVNLDVRVNPYRLFQLIVNPRSLRKAASKFAQLGRVFTQGRTLEVVVAFLTRCLSFNAKQRAFEKSTPGKLIMAGSRNFLPGAFLRSIRFVRDSGLPPDVCFSVVLQMLEQSRSQWASMHIDWQNEIRMIRRRSRTNLKETNDMTTSATIDQQHAEVRIDRDVPDWPEKYRPRRLQDVRGQNKAVNTLAAILKSGLRRPVLLTGPVGDGKSTLARIAASMVLCKEANPPCLKCPTCLQIATAAFAQDADFSSFREYESGWLDDYTIEEEFIKPYCEGSGLADIVMIDEVQELSHAKQGMLLKPLEMSASKSSRRFILCTSEPDKLTKALRSRCDVIELKHIAAADMKRLLRDIADCEKMEITDEGLLEIVFVAGGHARDAIAKLQDVHRRFPNQTIGAREVMDGQTSKFEIAGRLVARLVQGIAYHKYLHLLVEEVTAQEIPALIIDAFCNAIRIKEGRQEQIDHLPEKYRKILTDLPDEELYMIAGEVSMPEFRDLCDRRQIELFLAALAHRRKRGHFTLKSFAIPTSV